MFARCGLVVSCGAHSSLTHSPLALHAIVVVGRYEGENRDRAAADNGTQCAKAGDDVCMTKQRAVKRSAGSVDLTVAGQEVLDGVNSGQEMGVR